MENMSTVLEVLIELIFSLGADYMEKFSTDYLLTNT